MKNIVMMLYNIFFIYPLYAGFLLLGIFNKKVREGIKGREQLFENLSQKLNSIDRTKKILWFHSSSLGEFEQAKPIIENLKALHNITIVVTFFSPSGYNNSLKYPYADIVSYLPVDTPSQAKRFLNTLTPDVLVIMRYDLWPNHIYYANKMHVPVLLVDATMRKDSARKNIVAARFHKYLYGLISRILTVSENDKENFRSFEIPEQHIAIAGDTRYDQVYNKSVVARTKTIINPEIIANKRVFIAGSTWGEDEDVLLPVVNKLISKHKDFLAIIVPHEPTITHLEKLENELSESTRTIRFSHLLSYSGEQVILVDSIGILMTLYSIASIAFVGGSFKSNVHNVLEAAVYGIPVLYGPKIYGSQEAPLLAEAGGGFIVKNKRELYRVLSNFLNNPTERQRCGEIAGNFVATHRGATTIITTDILNNLKK